jgi:DNA polymerase-3 subunit beta
MKLTLTREALLKPLQVVSGVVERRQTLPILSNVLISVSNNVLKLVSTDLEVELVASTILKDSEDGEVTVAARKFLDICRALPEGILLEIFESKGKVLLKAGKSRFSLSTLPADEFPRVQQLNESTLVTIDAASLKNIIDKTYFAMAQQDVRYYLNGVLFEIDADRLRSVATDGHRLSVCDSKIKSNAKALLQAIIPRKGVLELQRLISEPDGEVRITISENHMRAEFEGITYTTKLVDGKFPDYDRVIPQNTTKKVVAGRTILKDALHRASILSNEKYRGVRLKITQGGLKASTSNPELEEAEEHVDVDYNGDEFEIGFNVTYIIDALAAVSCDEIELLFTDGNSSCLIQPRDSRDCRHVIMPMRL